ncbi:hypothetical protein Y032_0330g2708 [Ancylostoma ceylanicum]|uniref:7TM GPCR serpentine receptor class x (Srx) domain-containing protein n=1 Tax=Ancylostoma ceylanicum TaxID=53326 RepID=A0A016S0G6_9BILA|nr:hypothetical protein Y032_0330g2708 [Ancylostoma ceylanicum]
MCGSNEVIDRSVDAYELAQKLNDSLGRHLLRSCPGQLHGKMQRRRNDAQVLVGNTSRCYGNLRTHTQLSWLFDGGRDDIWIDVFGTTFVFCWYFNTITQVLMAVNRLIAVCFSSIDFFTYRNALIIMSALFPATILLTWVAQYLSPCCKTNTSG